MPPPLALPAGRASAPAGPIDGTWDVTAGSVAGFRVRESALGMTNDVVGRTNGVTGEIVVSGGRVTAAALRIDLTTIKVNGKTQAQFAKSLDTARHPVATFTLAHPVTAGSAFTAGAVVTLTATGRLTMHGASHLETFTISARRDGAVLQAAGSLPVSFPAWGIGTPPATAPLARSPATVRPSSSSSCAATAQAARQTRTFVGRDQTKVPAGSAAARA